MEGFFDFLHDLLPDSWFGDAQNHFGLSDTQIVQSVQEASAFFNMDAPMSIHEGWTTGVMNGLPITESDDILIFNREQLQDIYLEMSQRALRFGFSLMSHLYSHLPSHQTSTGDK